MYVMTYEALTRKLPTYLNKLLNYCSNETYNLRRNNTKLQRAKPDTDLLIKKSFSYTAAMSWKEFPNDITPTDPKV